MRSKKIYLNTPLQNLTRKEIARIGGMGWRWCRKNMGINLRKTWQAEVYFSAWDDDDNVCGQYDDESNEIFIYYRNCDDVREFLRTIIHEWKHHLQPLRSRYAKYKGPYYFNPFEVEARKAERENLRPLWDTIKPKVNRIYNKKT